jgi:hypothetical protein
MIGVLVGDEDGVQAFRLFPDRGQPSQDVALAQACVYEDARSLGADEGGVSRTAARDKL